VNLDWARLRAVVIESDDWGLCAWVPDAQARRVLSDLPAFRTAAGRRYGGSTLESADDVRRLGEALGEFRGGDGFQPVWQANTILAAPDYAAMRAKEFALDAMPLIALPETPSRWQRPGMWAEVGELREAGLWWPELHGLHHLPETAWMAALRRGADDARRAFEHQTPVCAAVTRGSEYDASEPAAGRKRRLAQAVERFTALVDRGPTSLCPPDYLWNNSLETQAESLGIRVIQGKSEQQGASLARARRWWHGQKWPRFRGQRLYMPPRIAFEPGAGDPRVGVAAAHRAARSAWRRRQPAVISTHRVNYAHLDADHSEAGRAALRDLLRLLAQDSAVFLTDAEAWQLVTRGWSVREIGVRGALLRFHGVPREPVRFAAPAGVTGAAFQEGRGDGGEVRVAAGTVEARVNVGEYLIEWSRA